MSHEAREVDWRSSCRSSRRSKPVKRPQLGGHLTLHFVAAPPPAHPTPQSTASPAHQHCSPLWNELNLAISASAAHHFAAHRRAEHGDRSVRGLEHASSLFAAHRRAEQAVAAQPLRSPSSSRASSCGSSPAGGHRRAEQGSWGFRDVVRLEPGNWNVRCWWRVRCRSSSSRAYVYAAVIVLTGNTLRRGSCFFFMPMANLCSTM